MASESLPAGYEEEEEEEVATVLTGYR